ncbi:MAG: DNA primase catalytic subunit [Amphiamblys sp. WSBS2006]|nr:MAG: DNA primase catalytic subunit [Amphiamblys sp. WSBS2006]
MLSETDRAVICDRDVFRKYLGQYYGRHFPAEQIVRWLGSATGGASFQKREFSFTLSGDIYVRYLSFSGDKDLRETLARRVPEKIDVGAVYTARPADRKAVSPDAFTPERKEVVFDIDMTDYDDVRLCCSKTEMCSKCWKFVSVGMDILEEILRDDFGFSQLLWVFSGRRGIHCWVSDERACVLENRARKALCSYIDLRRGLSGRTALFGNPTHPIITRALRAIDTRFEEIILHDQNIFAAEKGREYILGTILDAQTQKEIRAEWKRKGCVESEEYWKTLTELIEKDLRKNKRFSKNIHTLDIIKLRCLYPRLDEGVTAHTGHLLKIPFSIHPKTGFVSIPLRPKDRRSFDPASCVGLRGLVDGDEEALKEFKDIVARFQDFLHRKEDGLDSDSSLL